MCIRHNHFQTTFFLKKHLVGKSTHFTIPGMNRKYYIKSEFKKKTQYRFTQKKKPRVSNTSFLHLNSSEVS